MKDVAEHYRDVLRLGQALPAETLPVGEALGRILAEDVTARPVSYTHLTLPTTERV